MAAPRFCVSALDARTKWCPFVRAMNFQPQEGENPPVNRSASDFNCIADACMAWRWVETHINNPDAPHGDLIPSGDTHGYCGLAGDPRVPLTWTETA